MKRCRTMLAAAVLTAMGYPASADTVEIQTESGDEVASVVVETTNDVTGKEVNSTLLATDPPAVQSETQDIDPDAQVVNVQVSREQCVVDLSVKETDGTTNQLTDIDICGLDAIVIGEKPVLVDLSNTQTP